MGKMLLAILDELIDIFIKGMGVLMPICVAASVFEMFSKREWGNLAVILPLSVLCLVFWIILVEDEN